MNLAIFGIGVLVGQGLFYIISGKYVSDITTLATFMIGWGIGDLIGKKVVERLRANRKD